MQPWTAAAVLTAVAATGASFLMPGHNGRFLTAAAGSKRVIAPTDEPVCFHAAGVAAAYTIHARRHVLLLLLLRSCDPEVSAASG